LQALITKHLNKLLKIISKKTPFQKKLASNTIILKIRVNIGKKELADLRYLKNIYICTKNYNL